MFKLFNSITGLFSAKKHTLKGDTGYSLAEAIDQLINGLDPKLRLIPGYQKKIEPSIIKSLEYISNLVNQVPGPLEISRKNFITDPEVRAYFSTPDALQEIFSCDTDLQTFFELEENSDSDNCCALLCAEKQENQTLGTTLEGTIVRHDVLQKSVNFFDYKILSPGIDDTTVRKGIKQCIFDGLVTYALQHIASIRIERSDLTNRRRILHSQLRARQAQGSGLSKLLFESHADPDNSDKLTQEIQATEEQLEKMIGDKDVLSFYLDEIKKILEQANEFIQLKVICYRLNDMGIIVDNNSTEHTNEVCFSELEIANVMKRVVTIVSYDKKEINCNKQLN